VSGPHHAIAATRVAVRKALAQIEEGALVLVACSGGPDSLALAAAVAFEAPRAGLSAGAVVVDHNLQEGSMAVAERAADQCRALGLDPVEVVRVQVASPAGGPMSQVAGAGSGPESRARDARYQAFEDVTARRGAAAVLLGHTRDDQAEQVLLGLARGSGARSLAGMPARRGPYVRPLLGVARSTTGAACEAAGLAPWVDPHNSDPAYGRVRARALLPILEAELGPGTVAALARSADLLREDADALDDLAAQARDGLGPGQLISAAALRRLPTAVRTRVWRLLAIEAGCPPGALIATHIDSLDTLVTSWRGQGPIDLPGHVRGSRTNGRVLVASIRQVQ
jgi:tRNA(Ile)-lysidine synthase